MSTRVAEYYGQRTDALTPIHPIDIPHAGWSPEGSVPHCPFSGGNTCKKLKAKNEPVCSVRDQDGVLWISCSERLCSTKKDVPLCSHQKKILTMAAQHIFDGGIDPSDVCVKREESLRVSKGSAYHADFIITTRSGESSTSGPNRLVLEMQGGGETSDTGIITQRVRKWKNTTENERTNEQLRAETTANTLVTNAWRRQQEQFLIKGNIAMKTWKGLGIAFCVGTLLYDYLMERLESVNLPDLKDYNWTLALLAFKEDKSRPVEDGPIPLTIDEDRTLYTNYQTFVQALINQGQPTLEAFQGQFCSLENERIDIPF